MRQPDQGGSYVYDPKKDDLKQVEKPTEHINPNVKPAPDAAVAPAAPSTDAEADASKKGK